MTESGAHPSAHIAPISASTQSSEAAAFIGNGDGFAGEQIRLGAYELYRERGGRVGDDMGDWLQAEREFVERAPTAHGGRRDSQRA